MIDYVMILIHELSRGFCRKTMYPMAKIHMVPEMPALCYFIPELSKIQVWFFVIDLDYAEMALFVLSIYLRCLKVHGAVIR